jgi:hypothetical protein
MLPTPCLALIRACPSASSPSHSGRQSQSIAGPNVSVSPYRWVTSKPSSPIRRRIAGDGGAPPVATRTVRSSGPACGAYASIDSTVGAPSRWVTRSSRSSRHTSAGSTRRRQTWVAPAAVTAHGKHQPLQWNIGSVHRCTADGDRPVCPTIASACRYAPRWWYMTPFGRPVVPEV